MIEDQFQVVTRPHGECWLHKAKPAWVVHYPLAPRNPHYQAYIPAPWVGPDDLKGRDPWTVDSRRLSVNGFKTLKEAMQAAHSFEWGRINGGYE